LEPAEGGLRWVAVLNRQQEGEDELPGAHRIHQVMRDINARLHHRKRRGVKPSGAKIGGDNRHGQLGASVLNAGRYRSLEGVDGIQGQRHRTQHRIPHRSAQQESRGLEGARRWHIRASKAGRRADDSGSEARTRRFRRRGTTLGMKLAGRALGGSWWGGGRSRQGTVGRGRLPSRRQAHFQLLNYPIMEPRQACHIMCFEHGLLSTPWRDKITRSRCFHGRE
jgi:hypothetical protein